MFYTVSIIACTYTESFQIISDFYFQWVEDNKDEIKEKGSKVLFETQQTKVRMYME